MLTTEPNDETKKDDNREDRIQQLASLQMKRESGI